MSTRKHATIIVAAVAIAAGAAEQGLADGDFGPDTCLNGYVWREARPTDHVCVTPAVRSQTAADNAQAAARRSPTGGAFGPDTCLQGFVWREAFVNDRVCVLPPVRSQAAADNAAAASRRASVNLTLSRYVPPQPPCDGDTCSTNNDTAPRYRANADHVNVGQVRLFLRRTNGTRITSWLINATPNPAAPGGRISFRTGRLVCSGQSNAYFQLQDLSSRRLSPKRYVRTGCSTL
jgi:hypothetical protein